MLTSVSPQMLSPTESNEPLYLGYYRMEKTLGQGSYGKVKLATNIRNGKKYALKFIEKTNIKKPVHMTRIKREVRLLKLLYHPGIVELYEVAETEKEIILTVEYASGGELFDYIVAQHRLKEKDARRLFRQIVSAVDYCHQNCVIHRDLKPENLLLDENLNIKIIDFGFSNMFDPNRLMGTFCGSPFYASPEMILGKKYTGPEVDVWSVGVILFALLTGHLPFDDTNMKRLYNKIVLGEYTFPPYITPEAQDLIRKMICVNPSQRATLETIKSHPWFNEGYEVVPPSTPPVHPPERNIDERIFRKLAYYGFNPEESREKLSLPGINPVKATYRLLKERTERDENAQIAALPLAQQLRMQAMAAITEDGIKPKLPHPFTERPPEPFNPLSAGEIEKLQGLEQSRQQHAVTVSGPNAQHLQDATMAVRLMMTCPKQSETIQGGRTSDAQPLTTEIKHEKTPSRLLRHYPATMASRAVGTSIREGDSQHTATRRFRSLDQESVSRLAASVASRLKNKLLNHPKPNTVPPLPENTGIAEAAAGVSQIRVDPMPSQKLREVKGLFNVATSSTRPPEEIFAEVARILEENNITFTFSDNTFRCKDNTSSNPKEHTEFEIELCRIRNMGLYGLHLMRIKGDTWPYKRLCHRLTSQLHL